MQQDPELAHTKVDSMSNLNGRETEAQRHDRSTRGRCTRLTSAAQSTAGTEGDRARHARHSAPRARRTFSMCVRYRATLSSSVRLGVRLAALRAAM